MRLLLRLLLDEANVMEKSSENWAYSCIGSIFCQGCTENGLDVAALSGNEGLYSLPLRRGGSGDAIACKM